MASKIFLDANVFLDAYLQRDSDGSAARILQFANKGLLKAFTTPAVLHMVAHYLSKAMSKPDMRRLFVALLDDVTIIELTHQNAVAAVASPITDMEDALQYYAALQHGIEVFLSADKKFAKQAMRQLPVMSVRNFLQN